ncbi:hypothetical protein [Bradyrhizobium sp. UFLA05-112]
MIVRVFPTKKTPRNVRDFPVLGLRDMFSRPRDLDRQRGKADGAFVASRQRFMATRPITTLAESVCASVFQGFFFGSMDTVETAAEG